MAVGAWQNSFYSIPSNIEGDPLFIALEGIDSCGKTIQSQMLYNHMRKRGECLLTAEPTDSGPLGNLIDMLLHGPERFDPTALQLLYVADRASHVAGTIKPALDGKRTVITSRYFFSTIAYGEATGVDREWLKLMNSRFPLPDRTLIIDLDPEVALSRKRQQRLEQGMQPDLFERQLDLMKRVRKTYLELAKEYENCVLIDGSQSIEKVHEAIISAVERQ